MRTAIASLVALLIAPQALVAEELDLSVFGRGIYDSNVFGRSQDEVDDYSFRLSPRATLRDPQGDLTYEFYYEPSFEYFLDQSPLRGWDHDLRGKADYRLGPRTSVQVLDRFRRFSNRNRFNDTSSVAAGDSSVGESEFRTARDRFVNNTAQGVLTHSFSPTNRLTLSAYHALFEFSNDLTVDRTFYGAEAGLSHSLNARTSVGTTLRWAHQKFEPEVGRNNDTDFLSLLLDLRHSFQPDLTVSVQVGPAFVLKDRPEELGDTVVLDFGGVPVAVPVVGQVDRPDRTDVNVFADVSLEKSWADFLTTTVGYRRREDQGSSEIRSASILDEVFGEIEWRAMERLWLEFTSTWRRREQQQELTRFAFVSVIPPVVTPVLVDTSEELTTLVFAVRANYRLDKRTTLVGAARYVEEERQSELFRTRNTDRYVVSLGIRYDFEPFRF